MTGSKLKVAMVGLAVMGVGLLLYAINTRYTPCRPCT